MADFYSLSLEIDASGAVTGFSKAGKAAEDFGKKGGKAHKDVADAAEGLNGTIKKLLASYAALKVVEFSKESTNLAARYETLGVAMNAVGRSSGYAAGQLSLIEKALTKTGISMIESRQSILRLIEAHLDLGQAAKLGRVAQDAAVIGGINSSEAFGRLVTGIQEGSIIMLRTLGINVQFEASYQKMAAKLHTTAENLDTAQKAQARMNAVMEQGKTIAGAYEASMATAGKQIKSTERYLEDAKVQIATAFLPTYTKAVFAYAEALKLLGQNASVVAGVLKAAVQIITLLTVAMKAEKIVLALSAAFAGLTVPVGLAVAAFAAISALLVSYQIDASFATRETQELYDTMQHLGVSSLQSNIKKTAQEIQNLKTALADTGEAGEGGWITRFARKIDHMLLGVSTPESELREREDRQKAQKAALAQRRMNPLGKPPKEDTPEQLEQKKHIEKLSRDIPMEIRDSGRIFASIRDGSEDATDKVTKLVAAMKKAREATDKIGGEKSPEYAKYLNLLLAQDEANDRIADKKALVKYYHEVGEAAKKAAAESAQIGKSDGEKGFIQRAEAMREAVEAIPKELIQRLRRDDPAAANAVENAARQAALDAITLSSDKLVEATDRENDTLALNNYLIGLNKKQRHDLAVEIEFQSLALKHVAALADPLKGPALRNTLRAQAGRTVDLREEGADRAADFDRATQKTKESMLLMENAIRGIQTGFSSLFTNVLSGGSNMFAQLANNIKTTFIKLIAELAALKLGNRLLEMAASKYGGTKEVNGKTVQKDAGDFLADFLSSNRNKAGAGALSGALVGYGVGQSLYSGNRGGTSNAITGGLGGAAAGAMAGAAFGPVGATAGALAGLVTGIIGVGQAAKEARNAMLEMQKQVKLSMDALRAQVTGNAVAAAKAQIEADRLARKKAIEDAYSGGGAGSEQVRKRNAALAEMNKLEDELLAVRLREIETAKLKTRQDLEVRSLTARHMDSQAEKLRFEFDQQNEYEQALANHMDPATLALLEQVQAQEKLAFATRAATGAALNMVTGYRIQAAVFAAMGRQTGASGGFVPTSGAGGAGVGPTGAMPTPVPPTATTTSSPTPNYTLTVTTPILLDGKVLTTAVHSNLKAKAQRQLGDATQWGKVQ